MVEGCSKHAFKTWLAERPQAWRDRVEVVAMDGFTGFKTATTEELPDAVTVMDPFHVVRLAGDALDRRRRRVQQGMHGHRGRKDDPLYRARRTLHTGTSLLTDKQIDRLISLFADDRHVEVEATWGIYQRMIAAYRDPDRGKGRQLMSALIASVSTGVPKALSEVITLGRNLKKRAADVLAYFDRPGTSNGPTEAINGRLEHLRGSALGFRNLTNYIARSHRGVLRRRRAPPTLPRRGPPAQLLPAHHGHHPTPTRLPGPHLLPAQTSRREEPQRSPALPQAAAVRRGLPVPDPRRRPAERGGPGRTPGGDYELQRGRLNPYHRLFGQVTSRTRHDRPYNLTKIHLTQRGAV